MSILRIIKIILLRLRTRSSQLLRCHE